MGRSFKGSAGSGAARMRCSVGLSWLFQGVGTSRYARQHAQAAPTAWPARKGHRPTVRVLYYKGFAAARLQITSSEATLCSVGLLSGCPATSDGAGAIFANFGRRRGTQENEVRLACQRDAEGNRRRRILAVDVHSRSGTSSRAVARSIVRTALGRSTARAGRPIEPSVPRQFFH